MYIDSCSGVYYTMGIFQSAQNIAKKIETQYHQVVPSKKIRSVGEVVIPSVLLALVIRETIMTSNYIPSESMLPTIEINDRVINAPKTILSKWFYNHNPLSRITKGRIVTFTLPLVNINQKGADQLNAKYNTKQFKVGSVVNPEIIQMDTIPITEVAKPSETLFIKRVVATEGDTIEVRDGKLYINNVEKQEPYIKEAMKYSLPKGVIRKGAIFVLGDNRNDSFDSHYWGELPLNNIKSTTYFRYWPPTRLGPL